MRSVSIEIRGVVQGVGFRPFVYRLARALGLKGTVQNRGGRVLVRAEGSPAALDAFVARLRREPPEGAIVESIEAADAASSGATSFAIVDSPVEREPDAFISPDRRTCAACFREYADRTDRRFGYPLLSCASCGPRMTIVNEPPYDRARTTLARFQPCEACRGEYEAPTDRRFHVEGIVCATCGPSLLYVRGQSRCEGIEEPVRRAVNSFRMGEIGAIKGLGGYHLACDASNAEAVARLRRMKGRDEKPFALCVADLAQAEMLCFLNDAERVLLESPEAPIVLLSRRPDAHIDEAVAPGATTLGLMLGYTPLHAALVREVGGPLVLTSANVTEEPMATSAEQAAMVLGDAADFFLHHDRGISVRVDDAVAKVERGVPMMLRLGRGSVPASIPTRLAAEVPVLAVGGDYKSAFAYGLGARAIVSHHIGELERPACLDDFERAIAHYERLLLVRPGCIVHDLHPDFESTRYAIRRAAETGARLIAVGHHHAHLAATLADAEYEGRAIGVMFDGIGLGADGALWGGEFLVGDAASVRRFAHFRYVTMPGGDRASREGYRMAIAHLQDAALWDDARARALLERFARPATLETIARATSRGINAPNTSSVGRLFDAIACFAGVAGRSSYEGRAAIELEWAASHTHEGAAYPFEIDDRTDPATVDTRPLVAAVVRDALAGVDASVIARRFHDTIVAIIVDVAERARSATGLDVVALGGGVFVNSLLLAGCCDRLGARGFRVFWPRRVPPGDGGLCLGQLAVALASDA
ncbi:MAG: carbamoyltransferase HypF [Polyangiaceae bacterium]|nr:carbamoyltransferase HypF [Polyangiaceae bacterium]